MTTEDKPYPKAVKFSQNCCQCDFIPHIRGSYNCTLIGKKAATGNTGPRKPHDKNVFSGKVQFLPQLEG
jgi:hypothetical protein